MTTTYSSEKITQSSILHSRCQNSLKLAMKPKYTQHLYQSYEVKTHTHSEAGFISSQKRSGSLVTSTEALKKSLSFDVKSKMLIESELLRVF